MMLALECHRPSGICSYHLVLRPIRPIVKLPVPHTAIIAMCHMCNGMGRNTCGTCTGSGRVMCIGCSATGRTTCPTCAGRGVIQHYEHNRHHDHHNHNKHHHDHRVTETCNNCMGSQRVVCQSCLGAGRIACAICGSTGQAICSLCQGLTKLVTFDQVEVNFRSFKSDKLVSLLPQGSNTGGPSSEVVKQAQGTTLVSLKQQAVQAHDIPSLLPVEVHQNFGSLSSGNAQRGASAKLLFENLNIRSIPYFEVIYSHGNDKNNYHFWVYGADNEVFERDYPQSCCFGACAIV